MKRVGPLLGLMLALPESVRRVLVSPVWALGFVPFCLLFPERDVAYMPSGTTCGQLRSGGAPRGRGILAPGDPDDRGHGEHLGDRSGAAGRKLVFFDEATSALDNRTQALVGESLGQMRSTRLVIAHRPSTIRNADRIYVLDKGRIVESGSYDERKSGGGLFARMMSRQMA